MLVADIERFSQGDERDRCPHRCKLPRTSERHVEVFPKDHHEKGLRQSLTIFHALLVLFVQDRGHAFRIEDFLTKHPPKRHNQIDHGIESEERTMEYSI